MKIYYTFSEVKELVESYDNLKYFGWKYLLDDPNKYFVPLPTKYIPRSFYEDLLAKLKKIEDYSEGPGFLLNCSRRLRKFHLSLIVYINSGLRLSPVKDVSSPMNPYGFYDLLFTPIGIFFFFRKYVISGNFFTSAILSFIFPYAVFWALSFNFFSRASIFYYALRFPTTIRKTVPIAKNFIFFPVDYYWFGRFSKLLSEHNPQVLYKKPYARSYFTSVPTITFFLVEQYSLQLRALLFRLKIFFGFRTYYELSLTDKPLYFFYSAKAGQRSLENYKRLVMAKELETGNITSEILNSSVRTDFEPVPPTKFSPLFSFGRYCSRKLFFLLRSIRAGTEKPSFEQSSSRSYKRFWFRANFLKSEFFEATFFRYLFLAIKVTARFFFVYTPSLLVFPLISFFTFRGVKRPRFDFFGVISALFFRLLWVLKFLPKFNFFKFFFLFVLQFYAFTIFVSYILRKLFYPIFSYFVSYYHFDYFSSFRRYFIASKFYRFFTREIDEQLEESKPSWEDEFADENASFNELDESEFEVNNAESQIFESKEVSYEDGDVFGDSPYFSDDESEISSESSGAHYREDISDTPLSYDFFEDDPGNQEGFFSASLFLLWFDDAVYQIGSRRLEDDLNNDDDAENDDAELEDPSYEENFYSVYNFILPTENVRPLAVRSAYEYNKQVQSWYNYGRNKNFIKFPKFLLQSANYRSDLSSPITFSDWKKLTVCILPLLSKSFDPNKLNDPKTLKLVWDRLDYEISVDSKAVYNRLNDEEDFELQHSLGKLIEDFSVKSTIKFRFFELFFGVRSAENVLHSTLYRTLSDLKHSFVDALTPHSDSEMFYFCYLATLQANKDFPTFFRLYQSQLADDPKSNWILLFLEYKVKYGVSDSTIYKIIVPNAHYLDDDEHVENLESWDETDPSLRYTEDFTYQSVIVTFMYDIAAIFTGSKIKRVDFGSPDTTLSDPYMNVIRGGEYEEKTPGSIEEISAPDPMGEEFIGWGFFIPFYAKLTEAFYDPYINTIYFPGTFTEISEDFIDLDDEEEDLDAYDECIFTIDMGGTDDAQHFTPEHPNSIYHDDPETSDFIDPNDSLLDEADGHENTSYESAEEVNEFSDIYDGDLELYVLENQDNIEEWEYDEFSSYQDLSQPLSRLFFGSLKVDNSSFPAVDPRILIGPLSEQQIDTDASYRANFDQIKANSQCKALVPLTSPFYSPTVREPVFTLKSLNRLQAKDPRKRFLYRFIAVSIKSFRFFAIWFTQSFLEFEFYKSNFSLFSTPGKSISLYLHYKQHSHIYDNTISKHHARFVQNWIRDFEATFSNLESIKKAEKLNFFRKSTESKFHFLKDPFGRFWYQQPFVNDTYYNGYSNPDDANPDENENQENSYEDVLEESFEEILIDYLDQHSLSKDRLFDIYDKSRFATLDELEITNLTGADKDGDLVPGDNLSLGDNELEWDWGTMIGYSSDDDIYHKATEYVTTFDIFVSALKGYLATVFDYTIYIFRLVISFHIAGRYHYWSESADTWWLKAALKYGRWVYLFRYGAAFSLLATIFVYSYFVVPRIFYLFFYGVNSYFFTVFVHSVTSLLILVFTSVFLFRPIYDFYKSITTIERENLWLYIFLVWFFYIYYGYVSAPWNHFNFDSNVHKISNLSIEPDDKFYPRSHYQWPHINKTLESDRQITIYDMLRDRLPALPPDTENDKVRLVVSYSYSKAPFTLGNLYNLFTYYLMGVQNNFIVGYKYIYRTYNTPISSLVNDAGHTWIHNPHFINYGGDPKIKESVYKGNWRSYIEFSKTFSFLQYNYHLSDRTYRNSRFRTSHITSSEQNLPYLKSSIFYPYDSRTKELDFQYDTFYPLRYRMYSFPRRYRSELAPNASSLNKPRNRIKYTRFSSRFKQKNARIKFLQYRAYNHSTWRTDGRYLNKTYRDRKIFARDQIQSIYKIATKDYWYKKEMTRIGSALSFSNNFMVYVYSHYPSLATSFRNVALAPKKSFYATRGHPSYRTRQIDRLANTSKYDVFHEHQLDNPQGKEGKARPMIDFDANIIDDFEMNEPEDKDLNFFISRAYKYFYRARFHANPKNPPKVLLTSPDRVWFISRIKKYRQLHHLMNHFMLTNRLHSHNYLASNFVPYLTGNPAHQAYPNSKYVAFEAGMRKELPVDKIIQDPLYENPVAAKDIISESYPLFRGRRLGTVSRFPGSYYSDISNVTHSRWLKFSPRDIYGWGDKAGSKLDRRSVESTVHRFQEPYNSIFQYGGGIQNRFYQDYKKNKRSFLSKYAHYNRLDKIDYRIANLIDYENDVLKGNEQLYEWYNPVLSLNEPLITVFSMSCGFLKKNPHYPNGYLSDPIEHSYFQNLLLQRAHYLGYKNVYYSSAGNLRRIASNPKKMLIYDEIISAVRVGYLNVLQSSSSRRKPWGSIMVRIKRGEKKGSRISLPAGFEDLADNNRKIRAIYHKLLVRKHRRAPFWYANINARARSSKIVRRAAWKYKFAMERRLKAIRDRKNNKKKLITVEQVKRWSQEMDAREKDPHRNRGRDVGYNILYYDQAIAKRDKARKLELQRTKQPVRRNIFLPPGLGLIKPPKKEGMDELKGDRQIVVERERRRKLAEAKSLYEERMKKKKKTNGKSRTTNVAKSTSKTSKSSKTDSWYSWIFGKKSS